MRRAKSKASAGVNVSGKQEKALKVRSAKVKDAAKLRKGVKVTPAAVGQSVVAAVVACYDCGVFEFSEEDLALGEDWIQCCKCHVWGHESCGEKGGILDEDEFLCALCVKCTHLKGSMDLVKSMWTERKKRFFQ